MLSGKPKLKEKLINRNLNESDADQFIFFTNRKENKLLLQIEIQAVFNSNNSRKVMVIIDKKSTIDYLCMKIAEQMEKFEEFANLDGLKAGNLTKKSEKGQSIRIPSSGEMKDHVNDGDTIYFDLTTYQYWLKTNIKIISTYTQLTISLDIKFKLESVFKTLKFLLIKLGIQFWSDYPKGLDEFFHYTFTNAKFKTLKSKHNFELNINDLNKTIHIESMKIKELFDFNSEISCTINLISIEEILQKEIRNALIDPTTNNKLRWNEFKDLSFDAFYNDKKFEPEKQFLKRVIKKNLQSNPERSQNSFYLYNRSGKNKTTTTLEDDDMLTKVETLEDQVNLIILPRNSSLLRKSIDEHKRSMISVLIRNNSANSKRKYTVSKEINKLEQSDQKEGKVRVHRSFLEEKPNIMNISKSNSSSENEDENNLKIMDLYNQDTNNSKIDSTKIKKVVSASIISNSETLLKNDEGEIPLDIHENKEIHLDLPFNDKKIDDNNNDDVITVIESKVETDSVEKKKGISDKKIGGFLSNYRDTSVYSNLVNIFRYFFKSNKFVEIVEKYSTLKIPKNTLESISMPQFRDVKIQSELRENEIVNQIGMKIDEEEPLSVNNKKILLFIGFLIFVFICAIIVIFVFG